LFLFFDVLSMFSQFLTLHSRSPLCMLVFQCKFDDRCLDVALALMISLILGTLKVTFLDVFKGLTLWKSSPSNESIAEITLAVEMPEPWLGSSPSCKDLQLPHQCHLDMHS